VDPGFSDVVVWRGVLQGVLQGVARCCSVLQCVALTMSRWVHDISLDVCEKDRWRERDRWREKEERARERDRRRERK